MASTPPEAAIARLFPQGSVRGRLACDERAFHRDVARVLAAKGFFIRTRNPARVGATMNAELRLRGGEAVIAGTAIVVRHGRPGLLAGMLLRFTSLHPNSVQFPLTADASLASPLEAANREHSSPPAPAAPANAEPEGEPAAGEAATPPLERGTQAFSPDSGLLVAAGGSKHLATGLEPFDLLGGYQLLKRVGRGGMAEVYLARATLAAGTEKLVALKAIRPHPGFETPANELFLNEARIGLTLQHPNIVQVFDFGEALGRAYLAMEHVHGRSLASVLTWLSEAGQPPSPSLATAVCIEVCKALEYLHRKRDLEDRPLDLVHRDISPANIVISVEGEVKLLDFGVAAASFGDQTRDLVAGKTAYMAPEQLRGETPHPSWDVYALGLVLRQMLTLVPAGGGETLAEPILLPSAFNPAVPALLDRAVLDSTDPEPSRRTPSARSLRRVLEASKKKLPPIDLAGQMRLMFGKQFHAERAELQQLLVEARARVPAEQANGVLARSWRTARRKVLLSPVGTWLSRRPRLLKAGLVAALLAIAAGGYQGWSSLRIQRAYAREVALADERVEAALFVGAGGDAALDHLLTARSLIADDPRAARRLQLLADRFETLGAVAEQRGDDAEAAVHFQASLLADPRRAAVRARLEAAEERVRDRTRHQTRRWP